MKNILKITCFLIIIININCNAQILPLNNIDSPNGAYESDLDNVLPFWLGTWKGYYNDKEITLQFTLFTHQLLPSTNGDFIYRDMLMGKFKVFNILTNDILYDDLSIVDYSDFKVHYQANASFDYFFIFHDTSSNCNNTVGFTLSKNSINQNQIEYKDFRYGDNIYFDCQYQNQEDIPMFLPKVNLTLTRQ